MFKLNRLTDYAVVVMSQMTVRRDVFLSAPDIAGLASLPLPTVSKILNALSKAGLVGSQRGAAGGYALGRKSCFITVADIIQAMEGPIALTACVDGAADCCDVEANCPMRGHWNKVNAAIRQALDSVTLDEIAHGSGVPLSLVGDFVQSNKSGTGPELRPEAATD